MGRWWSSSRDSMGLAHISILLTLPAFPTCHISRQVLTCQTAGVPRSAAPTPACPTPTHHLPLRGAPAMGINYQMGDKLRRTTL